MAHRLISFKNVKIRLDEVRVIDASEDVQLCVLVKIHLPSKKELKQYLSMDG